MGRNKNSDCAQCEKRNQITKFLPGHGLVCVACRIELCAQKKHRSNVEKENFPAGASQCGSKRPREARGEGNLTHAEVVSSVGENRIAGGRIGENKEVITPSLPVLSCSTSFYVHHFHVAYRRTVLLAVG